MLRGVECAHEGKERRGGGEERQVAQQGWKNERSGVERCCASQESRLFDVVLQQRANRFEPTKPPYRPARYPQLLPLFRPIRVF